MESKTFWHYYFKLKSYKVRADAFAQECGYRNAVAVPEEDRDTFIQMFQTEQEAVWKARLGG